MSTIEIKNFKRTKGHDGQGFTLSLYVDNKRTAYVFDDGWGGPLRFEVLCKDGMDEFDCYVSKQPSRIFHGMKIDPNREIVISGLIDALFAKK